MTPARNLFFLSRNLLFLGIAALGLRLLHNIGTGRRRRRRRGGEAAVAGPVGAVVGGVGGAVGRGPAVARSVGIHHRYYYWRNGRRHYYYRHRVY